jgi:hydroxyacylglutathione hydrolase
MTQLSKELVKEIETPEFRIFSVTTAQFKEKSYIVQDRESKHLIVIDPGDALEILCEKIKELGQTLDYILLTHGHFDHLFSADQLGEKFNVNCLMHGGDLKLAHRAGLYSIRFSKTVARTPQKIKVMTAPSEVHWQNKSILILPSPGHTQGGVAILLNGVLFTGDTLFFEKMGPTNYLESNIEDLKKSVTDLLEACPPETIILPGHGRPWVVSAAQTWWKENSANPPQFTIIETAQPTSSL